MGSEMCIRDRHGAQSRLPRQPQRTDGFPETVATRKPTALPLRPGPPCIGHLKQRHREQAPRYSVERIPVAEACPRATITRSLSCLICAKPVWRKEKLHFPAHIWYKVTALSGCRIMALLQLPKLITRVRFPSPAPLISRPPAVHVHDCIQLGAVLGSVSGFRLFGCPGDAYCTCNQ